MAKTEHWTRGTDDPTFPTQTLVVDVIESGELLWANGTLTPGDIVLVSVDILADMLKQLGYERAEA